METITIAKREYKRLIARAKAYEKLAESVFVNAIKDPIEDIVSDFRKTNLYTEEFLLDLEDGLKKSSLSKSGNENKTAEEGFDRLCQGEAEIFQIINHYKK